MALESTTSQPVASHDAGFAPFPNERRGAHPQQTYTLADSFYETDRDAAHFQRTAHPVSVEPVSFAEPPTENSPVVIQQDKQVRKHIQLSPEQRMEDSFRIPIVATIVFVITMLAIFYLGSQVAGYYAPVVQGEEVEFVGRPDRTL